MQKIVENSKCGFLKSKVCLVISSSASAKGLDYAKNENIPSVVINRSDLSRDDFIKTQLEILDKNKIDLIVLAGYIKKLAPEIVKKYEGKILNIHPALLPKFGGKGMYGMNVHKAVIEANEKESGPTVHFVDEKYDNGKIVIQKKVPVLDNDTPETLQKRVLLQEYEAYSEAIRILETKTE